MFDPVQVARLPFNNTWSDEYRRQYFWEFFFKSSFIGEFRFPELTLLASMLMIAAMLCLPLLLLGIVSDLRHRFVAILPVSLSTLALLGAAIAYPAFFAYAPNQDFRFSIPLILPITYYIVRGARTVPKRIRVVAQALIVLVSVLSAAMLVAITL